VPKNRCEANRLCISLYIHFYRSFDYKDTDFVGLTTALREILKTRASMKKIGFFSKAKISPLLVLFPILKLNAKIFKRKRPNH
jgi:hypothetical protein